MKQKGFSGIIILIALAIVAVGAIAVYGYFIFTSGVKQTTSETSQTTVPLTENDPIIMETQAKLGTPECPEVDYTGCDTSGNFMTWTDDGIR